MLLAITGMNVKCKIACMGVHHLRQPLFLQLGRAGVHIYLAFDLVM